MEDKFAKMMRFLKEHDNSTFIERGDLRVLIMDSLLEEPKHGYQIIHDICVAFKGVYTPSAGGVYPKLRELESTGVVEKREERGKTVYSLTKKGEKEAKEQKRIILEIRDRFIAVFFGENGKPDEHAEKLIEQLVNLSEWTIIKAKEEYGKDPKWGEKIKLVSDIVGKTAKEIEDVWD
jgi:DNA-binding PadR family transcriptional regulator